MDEIRQILARHDNQELPFCGTEGNPLGLYEFVILTPPSWRFFLNSRIAESFLKVPRVLRRAPLHLMMLVNFREIKHLTLGDYV